MCEVSVVSVSFPKDGTYSLQGSNYNIWYKELLTNARELAIFLVIYFRNVSKFVVTHESGIGVIEYSEVVANITKKRLQRNECSLARKNVFKLESMQLLMGQQMQ